MTDGISLDDILVQLTILTVPFGVFSIETGFVNLSLPNLLIILTIIYFTITVILTGDVRLSKPQLSVLGLLCITTVTILISLAIQQGSPRRLVTYIGYLLITTILFVYIDSIPDVERVLRAAFLSAVAVSVLTIVHSVTYPIGLPFGQAYIGQRTVVGVTVPFQRTIGLPAISYGAFGMMLMISTPYYTYEGIKNRSKLTLFGVSLVLLAVLISQSRSTWVATGLAVFVVVSGYFVREYNRKFTIAYILSVFIPSVLLLPSVVESLVSIRSRTLSVRIEQYQVAINLLQSYPTTGVGLGNIDRFYTTYSIHSEFLRIGAEAGVIALLAIVAVWTISILFVARGMFSSNNRYMLAVGIIGSISAMVIEANMAPGFSKAPWIVLAVGLGVHSID